MTTQQSHIISALGINEMSDEEKISFFEQIGSIAMESALLRYTVGLEPAEKQRFEEWLESASGEDDFLPRLARDYPKLAEILDEEMTAVHSSIAKMV